MHTSYTWGLDLSGSMQGAGGVGGLLAVSKGTKDYFPTYDGNGNITEYCRLGQTYSAYYEYDSFGRSPTVWEPEGPFEYRFSTKPYDASTGFYYYGYRWYDPETGRWPSRDPIGERGGINLYGMVGNNAVGRVDILGLKFSGPYPGVNEIWNEITDAWQRILETPAHITGDIAGWYAENYMNGGGDVDIINQSGFAVVKALMDRTVKRIQRDIRNEIRRSMNELGAKCQCQPNEIHHRVIKTEGFLLYNTTNMGAPENLGYILGKGLLFYESRMFSVVDCCECMWLGAFSFPLIS